MALPWQLRKTKEAAVIIKDRNGKEGSFSERNEAAAQEDKPEDTEAGMHAAAKDLIDAIHAKDVAGVAAALKAAHILQDEETPDEDQEEPSEA